MSVAEMKLKAIGKIANLNDEVAINEILEHLEKFHIPMNRKKITIWHNITQL
jgi:hypothetical protein